MEKIPTAEELFNKYADNPIKWMKENNCNTTKKITVKLLRDFAKLHVKAALKAASEKAERKMTTNGWCNACNRGTTYVNEDSILNAYPDDLIQ